MKKIIKTAGSCLANIIFPRTCLHCRKDLAHDDTRPLCRECFLRLKPLPTMHCKRCGLPLPDGGAACYDCRGAKAENYKCSLIRSAFVFNPEIRSVIHAFKYRGMEKMGAVLGGMMAEAFAGYPEFEEYGAVAFIPLSLKRQKERGFNQAELLARAFAETTGLKFLGPVLSRTRETAVQANLSRGERFENVKDAFAAVPGAAVGGLEIIIVDDVATTGATLEACAKALKKAGAKKTAGYVIAREP